MCDASLTKDITFESSGFAIRNVKCATQVITEDIDRCAATLLHQLLQWQERARAARDARSGGRVAAKKRLVSGLR